jgi:hypothetical protein
MVPMYFRLILLLILFFSSKAFSATINIGAVAMNDATGYYLKEDGSFNTYGKIRVGSFSLSESQLFSIINSWTDTTPTYEHYSSLSPYFKEIGVGGDSGSIVSAWNFATNGVVAGTSTNVNLTYLPANSQLYIWAFDMTSYNKSDFNTNSQWCMVTSTNWYSPSIGTKSLNLAVVTSQDVLLGTDLSPVSNSVKMVAAIPEPKIYIMFAMGIFGIGIVHRKKLKYFLLFLISIMSCNAQAVISYSSVIGYEKFLFSPYENVLTSPFINQPIYSGNATVSNNTFIINSIITNNISQTPYYVEITSTNYNGYIFDILSNNQTFITVQDIPKELQSQLVSINIRPHVTLGQFINGSSGFQDYSDALTLTNINGNFISFYYTSDGIVADDYFTPANNTIIYPNNNVIINNCGNISIILYGEVINN